MFSCVVTLCTAFPLFAIHKCIYIYIYIYIYICIEVWEALLGCVCFLHNGHNVLTSPAGIAKSFQTSSLLLLPYLSMNLDKG